MEVRTTAGDSGDNCHQEAAEWKLESVTPSAPPLPPEVPCPQRPQDKGWLTLAPFTLPRLRPPLPLPKMASVLWEVTSRPQVREGATESS